MSINGRLFILGALLALPVLFAGCGGGGDDLVGDPGMVQQDGQAQVAQVGPDGKVRVIISLTSGAGNADRAMVTAAGGRVRHVYRHVNAMSADLPEQAITALGRNPRVTLIERAAITHTADLVLPWGVDRIDDRVPPPLPESSNRGSGVIVAIIDSGVDYSHPDLSANYDARGYDFVNSDSEPMDDHGHGTHCAGIVAANKPASTDYGVVGVAPAAKIVAYKVLDAAGSGTSDDLIAAIDKAIAASVNVISMSMGSSVGNTELENVCNKAYGAGIVLVAAAGNNGFRNTRVDTVIYPAKYASVIAVGATDIADARPTWSSTGPAVELCAPGNNIFSTYLTCGGNPIGYATMSGTSMACPHVSGSAALAIASGLSGSAVRDHLVTTADDLGPTGRDVQFGYGIVDADEAAREGAPPPNVAPTVSILSPADGTTAESGASITFTGEASDSEDGPLSAAIAWSSSRDGALGVGATVSAVLSDGTHTITAKVTDSGGATASDSISVTVGSSSGGGSLIVGVTTDKSSYTSGETAMITVTVTDGAAGLPGAAVALRITTPKNKIINQSATTGSDGVASFTYKTFAARDGAGAYALQATASLAGYETGTGASSFEVR